jgi:hypothetical protein
MNEFQVNSSVLTVARRVVAPVSIAIAVFGLAACSSSGGHPSSARTTTPIVTSPHTTSSLPTTVVTRSSAPASPAGRATIRVTGGMSISATGTGALCAYYYPSQHSGLAYSVSSTSLTAGSSSVGGWSLQVADDTGHNLGVILNTDHGSWTSTRTISGTVHANPNLHHADFSLDLVKVVGQQHAHLSGSIDCP